METAWFFVPLTDRHSFLLNRLWLKAARRSMACPSLANTVHCLCGEMNMDSIEIVRAYYAALDASNMAEVDQYLADDYQLVDFTPQPMDKEAMLNFMRVFKSALPNLKHSLSNIRIEDRVVKLTVQRSGTNTGPLDLREMGIGVVPRTQKFIIFPNANSEFTIENGKIIQERDVSPVSPSRRMSGLLKALGVNLAAL
ncbi:MAG: nuclear transport factor 2 family protein [Anaerolineaceae bacterium]|jgi:predicted ester cyclase|nr:nuclear transport factor 2 family protein [Anaerolineaceae bacterium]